MFSRQKLTHAYYAFTSYVGRDGHLYKVFLVLAKLRLISDEMCHLYRKFMSYLRRLLYRMRLIFPHINGLLSSYVPQILLQPVRIIARKFANHHASPYVSTMEQSQSIQESCPTICSSSCLPSYPFFVVRCLRWCQAHVQAVALWAAFCHANNIAVKSAICPSQSAIHFDDMCPAHHCPASSEQLSFSTKFLTPIGNV